METNKSSGRAPTDPERGMAMQIHLRKDADGLHIVSGRMRLQTALSVRDEVKVESPGIGEVLIVKLPDGRLVATQDTEIMALFGLW